MRDEKEERKKQARSNKQTKAKQHSTPKAVTFPRKNELPQVGLEPTTLYTLDRALYQCLFASKLYYVLHVLMIDETYTYSVIIMDMYLHSI